jgi:dihydroflavonol-4-reductase
MRAFVTGATGLLGNNLVRTLLDARHEVLALARSPEKAARELGDTRARVVRGDMADVPAFAEALEGVDVLFHTAAYFREYYTPGDHAAALERINVEGTMELARAAHARGVGRMIDTSSSGMIGRSVDGSPGDESAPPSPMMKRNLYVASKRKVEPLLRAFAREKAFFIASVLPAWIWGPHDAAPTPSGQLARDALLDRLPPGIPPGGASVVDARDVAAGMLRIAEVGRSAERYILSGPLVELGDILKSLAALTGARAPTFRIPFPAALLFAAAVQTWSRVTGTVSPMSVQGLRMMNARHAVTAAKAERELGISFRPFQATLADTVAWMRTRLTMPQALTDTRQTRATPSASSR